MRRCGSSALEVRWDAAAQGTTLALANGPTRASALGLGEAVGAHSGLAVVELLAAGF